MKDHKLSPAMRKALVHEWWALPKFTVIGMINRLAYAALTGGLIPPSSSAAIRPHVIL